MLKKLSILIITFIFVLVADAQNVYQWRGNDRLGIFGESNLLKEWPVEGPTEIWSIDNVGNGFVSPVFTEQNFYITGETDSMLILYCYGLQGKKEWQTTLGREWMRTYPGSRSIPTIVDDLIYVGSGMGNLYCLKRKDGTLVWSKDLIKDLGGILPLHGHSEAALVDGKKVYWTVGGKVNNFVALDRFTGKMIWTNKGFGETSAYNSPKLIEHSGRKIIVTFSAYHMMGFDAETGKLLWGHEQDNYPLDKRLPGYGDTHCNTVLYENGSIYYAEGDGNCGVKLNISPDGSSIKEVWRNTGFDSYMGGIVKIGDFIYGSGTVRPVLRSINAGSGQLVDSLKIGTGALVSADNMLYYYSQKGDLALVGFDNGKLQMISSFRIRKGNLQHFSHPVINKGILYQRHGKVLMAFDIQKK